MNTKQASASSVSSPSGPVTRRRRSRPSSPSAAVAELRVRTSMFGSAAICSIRYCDIDFSSDGPRTSIVTRPAYPLK